MKKRKSALLGFLLAAVMGIGVGYATVSQVLDITGTAVVSEKQATDAFDEDIFFSNVTTGTSASESYTARVNADNNDKITFTVESLADLNDSITFTATIANSGAVAANVVVTTQEVVGNYKEYFEITTDLGTGKQIAAKSGEQNGTLDVQVTVKLVKTPTTAIDATFAITLQATSIDA
jgi:hypothetical protein